MTAKTSQHLADVLRAAGLESLAERAERDEFHDYLSDHIAPANVLSEALVAVVRDDKNSERLRMAAHHVRQRLFDGEFDASTEESDAWAASPEGRAAFKDLETDLRKAKRKKP